MFPTPGSLAKGNANEIPEVVQLGTITLEELNKYHCNNPDRRLLCLFGDVFDVTSSEKGYGQEGACKFLLISGMLSDKTGRIFSLHSFPV